jgi:hypothetical protein
MLACTPANELSAEFAQLCRQVPLPLAPSSGGDAAASRRVRAHCRRIGGGMIPLQGFTDCSSHAVCQVLLPHCGSVVGAACRLKGTQFCLHRPGRQPCSILRGGSRSTDVVDMRRAAAAAGPQAAVCVRTHGWCRCQAGTGDVRGVALQSWNARHQQPRQAARSSACRAAGTAAQEPAMRRAVSGQDKPCNAPAICIDWLG